MSSTVLLLLREAPRTDLGAPQSGRLAPSSPVTASLCLLWLSWNYRRVKDSSRTSSSFPEAQRDRFKSGAFRRAGLVRLVLVMRGAD